MKDVFDFYLSGMRHVRTARRKVDSVQPKGRLIIPGHLDPQIGTWRTDASTTSWVSVQIAVTISASLNISGETIDVSAALLSRMPIDRSTHISARHVASLGKFPKLRPGHLLQILIGAYVLTEATYDPASV